MKDAELKDILKEHEMKNDVLRDIKEYAIRKLKGAYGYCAVASSDDMAMITCDDKGGNDIKINITIKPE